MVATEKTKNPAVDCPPLTVLPVAGDPHRFYCLGKHEWWYHVTLATDSQEASCECKGWEFRSHCAHMDAVHEYLKQTDPCPVCRGEAFHHPNGVLVYVDVKTGEQDRREVPRACCGGAGTRSAWEAGGRVGVVRTSGLSEEQRRALFER